MRQLRYCLIVGLFVPMLACKITTTAVDKDDGNSAGVFTIEVTPATATTTAGGTKQFTAVAKDLDGNVVTGVTFTWNSSDRSVATIDANGLASGVDLGVSTISASVGDDFSSGYAVLSVAAPLAPPLVISSSAPIAATAGATYAFTFTASGGTPPYEWRHKIVAPDYYGGLDMDLSTGVLSGVPALSGTLPLVIEVTDADYNSTAIQYDFAVGGTGSSRAITTSPPSGAVGLPYQFRFDTSWSNILGCSPNLSFVEGTIPPGLTLNLLSGDLGNPPAGFGTPIAAGTYTFTLAASTNSYCLPAPLDTNAQTFTMSISGASAMPGAANWSRASVTPVLAPSTTWDGKGIHAPSVIKTSGTYLMAYEAESSADHHIRIGTATSADGISWTPNPHNPVIDLGDEGDWDGFYVRYPSLHFDGTTYRMWFLGRNQQSSNAEQYGAEIGLATSSDGSTWVKRSEPVTGMGTYGGNIPGTVLHDGSKFLMWYATPYGDIGRATSADGIAWTDDGVDDSSAYSAIGRPSIVKDGSTYRMWFARKNSLSSGGGDAIRVPINLNIAFATSADGLAWTPTKQNPSVCFFCTQSESPDVPSLSQGAAGAWDRPGVSEPTVIKDGSGFKMWYVGGNIHAPSFGSIDSTIYVSGKVGYATSP